MKLDQIKKIFKLVTFIEPELKYIETFTHHGQVIDESNDLRIRFVGYTLYRMEDRFESRGVKSKHLKFCEYNLISKSSNIEIGQNGFIIYKDNFSRQFKMVANS